MRPTAFSLLVVATVVGIQLLSGATRAADAPVRVIAHPDRGARLTAADVRAIYLKRRRLWPDGAPIIPINREAGSVARELFSQRVFGQGSRRLASYWNQRYFESGEFPPATMASDEAILRFVSQNPNAVGYITADDVGDDVSVVLVLD